MAEYITKENALAKLEKCARDPYHDTHYIRAAVINTIKRMEAADVVEVVRCKDCIWWDDCDELDENGYCHHGERKDYEID